MQASKRHGAYVQASRQHGAYVQIYKLNRINGRLWIVARPLSLHAPFPRYLIGQTVLAAACFVGTCTESSTIQHKWGCVV